jgi:hypothetical protein
MNTVKKEREMTDTGRATEEIKKGVVKKRDWNGKER